MGVEIKESVISDAEFRGVRHFASDCLSVSVGNEDDDGRMRWYPWHSVEYRPSHILNVVNLTTRITDREGADMNIVRVTALFHDISKLKADQEAHAEESIRVIREFPGSHGDYPDSFVDQVRQVVPDRPYQGPLTDVSSEARCLIEVDILDKIGANGAALMLLRMGYKARTHMDAIGVVEYILERGRDAPGRLETDTV